MLQETYDIRERVNFTQELFDRAFRDLSQRCSHKIEYQEPPELSHSKELSLVVLDSQETKYVELPDYIDFKALRKLVRQYTHPDKLLRVSAKDKEVLLALYRESATEDYQELIFILCYVLKVVGSQHRIKNYYIDILEAYSEELKLKLQFLLRKWFADAAILYGQGRIAEAEKVFKSHLYSDDDCFD